MTGNGILVYNDYLVYQRSVLVMLHGTLICETQRLTHPVCDILCPHLPDINEERSMELERLNTPTAKAILVVLAIAGLVVNGFLLGTLFFMW